MIVNKLNELLDSKGISKPDFAKMLGGVSRQYIHAIIKPDQSFGQKKLNALCKVLNCQPGDILKYIPD